MRAGSSWSLVFLVILLACTAKEAFCLIFPVGGDHNHSGFIITLDLGGKWYSKKSGKWYRGHLGEDYASIDGQSKGKPVRAIMDGKVVFAENGGTGWGEVVVIKHGNKEEEFIYSQYAHLQNLRVQEGNKVEEGQQIGEIGQLPQWVPHLHFEIKTQEAVDQEGLIGHGYSGKDAYAPNRIRPSEYISGSRPFKPVPMEFKILSVYPQGEIQSAGQEIPLKIEFSKPIDERTIFGNIVIGPDPILSLDPQFTLSSDKLRLSLLGYRFSYNLPYIVLIYPGLKSQKGESLAGITQDKPLIFRFMLRQVSARPDTILFCMEEQNGQTALWTINSDGTGLKKWMDWEKNWSKPSFSPDGRKMFYDQSMGTNMWLANFIYSKDLTTGQTKQIFPAKEDYTRSGSSPMVSPDGRQIIFRFQRLKKLKDRKSRPGYGTTEDQVGNPQNWIMNTDGSGAHSLGGELDWYTGSSWSKNGREIIFADLTSLFAYNFERKTFRDIVGRRGQDGPNIPCARWSPTSDWIAFLSSEVVESHGSSSGKDFWHDLYLVRPDGKEKKLLVGDLRYLNNFDWSNDGNRIILLVYGAYLDPGKGCKLIIVNVENPTVRRTIFQTKNSIPWVMWNSFRAQ